MVDIFRYIGFAQIPIERYDGLLIDLDDTLYSYEPCHRAALKAAFTCYNTGLDARTFAQRYREERNRVTARLKDQGACRSRLFAFQSMGEALGWRQPYNTAFHLNQAYWNAFLSAMKLDPQAYDLLTRCKRYSIPVAVVTDMTAQVQIEKLQRLGLVDLIDHLVTSEEIGHEKPHCLMFEAGLRKIGVRADRALMVGDHKLKDLEGAAALGIDGALIIREREAA